VALDETEVPRNTLERLLDPHNLAKGGGKGS
jgi:hypothetical protein